MHARKFFLISCSLAALTLAACSDDAVESDHDHDADHDHGSEHDHTSCGLVKNCMDTVELKKGLMAEGASKKLSIEVLDTDPLTIMNNRIVFTVRDANGDAVKDATITQDVFSADCMHGGPKPPQTIEPNADGNYEIMPVHEHQGPWNTTLAIKAGSVSDDVTLPFCVPDPEDAG